MSEKEKAEKLAEEMEKVAEIIKISEGVAQKVRRYFDRRPKNAPAVVYPSKSQVQNYVAQRKTELSTSSTSYIMTKTAEEIIRNIVANGKLVLRD